MVNRILTAVVAALLMGACTEDKVQKNALKYEVYPKPMIDTSARYMFQPTTLSSSRKSQFGRAYWMGQTRVVRLELTEFAINAYSVEREEKFASNPSNDRLVFSIPVEHIDYRCADDAFGECTSEEVANERIPWNQRRYFIPKFEEAKFADANSLPQDLPDECFEKKEVKLVMRKIEPNSINFRLDQSFQNNINNFFCTRNLEKLEDLNWSSISQYSLVKLDDVISPDYQTAIYNPDWINTFGFFEEDDFRLDVDGSQTQATQIKYISRWSPSRKEIVYHLSPEFEKPENDIFKAATIESFKRMNAGLKSAGAKFQLRLENINDKTEIGDLRYNHIILAEDPFEASVIGYGPSTVNPYSGEIVSARTVMYLGSLKRFIRYTYDEILLEHKKALSINSVDATTTAQGVSLPAEQKVTIGKSVEFVSKAAALAMIQKQNEFDILLPQQIDRTPFLSEDMIEKAADRASREDRIMELSKQGFYPAEALDFGDVSQEVVSEIVKKIGSLEPWETLTDTQKQAILDTLAPYVWVPTLIHEIGHNLGLRHNFAGSEDKDHYYSTEELKKLNVPVSSKNVPYSSVMEYPKSEINALRTFGKYDIAALRFAYTGQVLKDDGTLAKVDSSKTPPEGLKRFKYCTDEGVEPNPTCNPFDEGSNMKEIAQSLIDSYKDGYLRSNFRRGRAQFSGFDDDIYLGRINRTFKKLRLIFERYQDITQKFQLDQKQIDEIDWIKDLDEAVVLAGDFMMDVIREPDVICVIQDAQGQIQVAPIDVFGEFSHGGTRECADIKLNPGFTMVGQGGKAINSFKLPTNPNRYADQIDVRGTWIDKTLAMRTLFRRTLNSTLHDDINGNFMDHPKVAPKLAQFVQDVLNNQLPGKATFRFIDGTESDIEVGYSLADPTYEVRKSELPIANWNFRIKYDNMILVEALASVMNRGLAEGNMTPSNLAFQKDLAVRGFDPEPGTGKYIGFTVGDQDVYVSSENQITFGLMKKLQAATLLSETNLEVIEKVQDLLVKKGDVSTLTPKEKQVYDLGLENINLYMRGLLTPGYYSAVMLSLL